MVSRLYHSGYAMVSRLYHSGYIMNIKVTEAEHFKIEIQCLSLENSDLRLGCW